MIKFILLDIEGTTTSISFVYDVLFPYFKTHVESYCLENKEEAEVIEILNELKQTVREESGADLSDEEAVNQMIQWTIDDRKHTAMKRMQGKVWKSGFESGEIKSHLYADVVPVLNEWKDSGMALGIYSSGSVAAQKLLFAHTEQGDLTNMLSYFFDTNVGHKREVISYENISKQIGVEPESILFLSDVGAELEAAEKSGMKVIQILRPGNTSDDRFVGVADFREIDLAKL